MTSPNIPHPIDVTPEDALRQLERIARSAEFAGAPRQQSFLRFVMAEALAGRGHEIKETLVAISVYGKPASYDPRIDSTVRVEAAKLRQRLNHYYEGTGAADPVRIAIPKGSYQPQIEPVLRPSTPRSSRVGRWRAALLVVAAALASLGAWRLWRTGPPPPDPARTRLSRFTEPGSFSAAPAISKQGDIVVYASDREGGGALNLWRQPLDGGAAVRLTKSGFNHDTPTVGEDGTIVFHTEERGGMLAQVKLGGGESALIRETAGGRNPRFAPRGSLFVYWVPRDEQTSDYGQVWLDTLDARHGFSPVRLFGDFAHAAFPIWSERGTHVLALGTWQSTIPEKEYDAWVVELDGVHSKGLPRKTGLFPALKAAGLYRTLPERMLIEVADWRGDWLYVTLPAGETLDLFRVRLRPGDGSVSSPPERITFGVGAVKRPRVTSGGGIVFARSEISYNLYSLRLSPERGPAQDLRRHTSETGQSVRPAVHASGNSGVWEILRPGLDGQVWYFDLVSGARQKLGWGDERPYSHALISPDGRFAAYRVSESGNQPIYQQPVTGGTPKRICHNCGAPSDWTSDGRHMFYITGGQPAIVGLLDVATGRNGDLIQHPSQDLFGARARLNPAGDGFVALYADNGQRTRQIQLVPFRRFQPASADQWIPVTDGAHWDQSPAWAPDGRTLYYVSRHEGFSCIMARSIDPLTGKPQGPSWAVQHFHSPALTLMRSSNRRGADALWVAGGRIFFTLDQRSSDLWKISVLAR
jgi:Tol biopolymer transport system component